PASRMTQRAGWHGYIALHKNVKTFFAVQYGSPIGGLTVLQSACPSLAQRAAWAAVEEPSRLEIASRRTPKRSEKFRKPPFLTRPIASPRHDRGVSASHGARRGTRTGEIPCCGSGPEPVTGFVGVCSVLLLQFSRYQPIQ